MPTYSVYILKKKGIFSITTMPLSHLAKVTLIIYCFQVHIHITPVISKIASSFVFCVQDPYTVFGCWSLNGLISYLHGENKAVHFIHLHGSEY